MLSRVAKMGRTAQGRRCDGLYPPSHWAMRTAASSDALRGAIGRARRTDPPSGGLFHFWRRFRAARATPLRTISTAQCGVHESFRPFARSPRRGRRAAPACRSAARRRRAGAGDADTTREFESVSRVAERARAHRRRRRRRAHAARRDRGALRRRLRRPDLRLRRRQRGVRLPRALARRGRRLVAGDAARPRARAVGHRERGLRGDGVRGLRRGGARASSAAARRATSARRAPRSSRCSSRSA